MKRKTTKGNPVNPTTSPEGERGAGVRITPQQKIMRAARSCRALSLSCAEVYALSKDGAIRDCAANDDEKDEARKR